jgi:GAF domain-containing protein
MDFASEHPEAYQRGVAQAAGDHALLARLRASGAAQRRDGEFERAHPEVARPFVRDIEARADQHRVRGIDTIRPNRKKAKKRGRR